MNNPIDGTAATDEKASNFTRSAQQNINTILPELSEWTENFFLNKFGEAPIYGEDIDETTNNLFAVRQQLEEALRTSKEASSPESDAGFQELLDEMGDPIKFKEKFQELLDEIGDSLESEDKAQELSTEILGEDIDETTNNLAAPSQQLKEETHRTLMKTPLDRPSSEGSETLTQEVYSESEFDERFQELLDEIEYPLESEDKAQELSTEILGEDIDETTNNLFAVRQQLKEETHRTLMKTPLDRPSSEGSETLTQEVYSESEFDERFQELLKEILDVSNQEVENTIDDEDRDEFNNNLAAPSNQLLEAPEISNPLIDKSHKST